jgi:hypothetical protein
MTTKHIAAVVSIAALAGIAVVCAQNSKSSKATRTSPVGYSDTPVLPGQKWRVHDIARPHPPQVTPGAQCGAAPSDATVLFDGKNFSHWTQIGKGKERGKTFEPRWKLEKGYMEVTGDTGDLVSKEKFGTAQYHIEWAANPEILGSSQWRGNSGVLIMNRYEFQVLDSWNNPTYADGQAGSIYGQWPPMVSPIRKPGEWHTYDILFEAPRFEGGKLVKPAYATVLLNGVAVHHHQEIVGRMAHRVVGTYAPHANEEPLGLQDHDTAVRYRNIWVRPLRGYDVQ